MIGSDYFQQIFLLIATKLHTKIDICVQAKTQYSQVMIHYLLGTLAFSLHVHQTVLGFCVWCWLLLFTRYSKIQWKAKVLQRAV